MYSRTPVTRSNSEGTRKTVRVSGGLSYRGRLNLQFAMFKAEKKKLQQNASLKNSHRNNTNRVFYQKKNLQVDRSFFASYGTHAMNYFVSLGIFMHQGRRTQR